MSYLYSKLAIAKRAREIFQEKYPVYSLLDVHITNPSTGARECYRSLDIIIDMIEAYERAKAEIAEKKSLELADRFGREPLGVIIIRFCSKAPRSNIPRS